MCEKTKHYSFFQNRECEYFPCHDIENAEDFNCLFCFCPLYALGKHCGGNCTFRSNGNKDCSGCTLPHERANYQKVLDKYGEIMDLIRKNDSEKSE